MKPRVLELGSYIAPAYAGMILAEQGFDVVKCTLDARDPIHSLHMGDELWRWINAGKQVRNEHARDALQRRLSAYDLVVDNFRASTLARWDIIPKQLAVEHHVAWVSLRPEIGERSFDVVAQAQAWADFGGFLDFYIGDTTAGLWLAFKLLAMWARGEVGHRVIPHATALAKLVEGELVVDRPSGAHPFDAERYGNDGANALVEHRGTMTVEPVRDRAWRLKNLRHINGRLIL